MLQQLAQVQQMVDAALTLRAGEQALGQAGTHAGVGMHPLLQHGPHASAHPRLVPRMGQGLPIVHCAAIGQAVGQCVGWQAPQAGGQSGAQAGGVAGRTQCMQPMPQVQGFLAVIDAVALRQINTGHTALLQGLAHQAVVVVAAHQHRHLARLDALALHGLGDVLGRSLGHQVFIPAFAQRVFLGCAVVHHPHR